MGSYIKRGIEPILKKAAKEFPAVIITGPRQAGKTTLLKHVFKDSYQYVSLEPPDLRVAANSDPRGFIELYPAPVIFDEIQYAPELFFYIKEKIDEDRDRYGQYILTGSQNVLLLEQVSETLAGRAAILKLLPLSYAEKIGAAQKPFPWEQAHNQAHPLSIKETWTHMLIGGYPELTEHPKKDSSLWHSSYIQTYLERDVRNLRQIGDLTQFQVFLRALAARSAHLFAVSEIAKDIGVSVNTIKSWLAILEATYQIIIVRPYYANIGKRLVKMPKVYFTDVGTLCYLTGLKDIDHLSSGPLAGAAFETYVVSEVYKRLASRGIDPLLYFWRTSTGVEVDLLVEDQNRLIPIEVKATATPKPQMAKPMASLKQDISTKVEKGFIIHLGDITLPMTEVATAIPFSNL